MGKVEPCARSADLARVYRAMGKPSRLAPRPSSLTVRYGHSGFIELRRRDRPVFFLRILLAIAQSPSCHFADTPPNESVNRCRS